jgi:hypothetical protein
MTDSISMRSAGAELAAGLAAIKAEIDAEIGAYPTPIPRCDAQFNRLYEQRTELAGTIAALNDALADDTTAGNVKAAIGGFVARAALHQRRGTKRGCASECARCCPRPR